MDASAARLSHSILDVDVCLSAGHSIVILHLSYRLIYSVRWTRASAQKASNLPRYRE